MQFSLRLFSLVFGAAIAAGCSSGAIGGVEQKPAPEPFSPASGTTEDSSIATPVEDAEVPADTLVAELAEDASVIADTATPDTNPTPVPDTMTALDTSVVDTATSAPDTRPAPDTASAPDTSVVDTAPALVWRSANLTWFESYPDPGSEECIKYSGCTWAGQFAALSGVQPESWVKANNIIAVHGKDFAKYKLKTLRLKQGTKQIDAKVYDMCADSDCSGCCTANSSSTGFLIDLEKYTAERFGTRSGVVQWTCLDC